mmetsp:Transcript_62550/g.135953  ORF Transcript_62550/g.135953 Transcript_62550/m.135953 type:complete len:105 (+) Transcript_62550:1143-1457(+)
MRYEPSLWVKRFSQSWTVLGHACQAHARTLGKDKREPFMNRFEAKLMSKQPSTTGVLWWHLHANTLAHCFLDPVAHQRIPSPSVAMLFSVELLDQRRVPKHHNR